MNEAQIWSEMLEGSSKALEQLYRKYVQILFDYGNKISRDPIVTEDCIQNLFVDLWAKRNKLTHTENVQAYLYLSLRRRIYRYQEQNRRTSKIEDSQNIFILESNPEKKLIEVEKQDEQMQALQKALDQLNAQQKEILYLKYQRNLKSEEIAEILGIKNQSVRNALHRAISKMKKLMVFSFFMSTVGHSMYYVIKQFDF